MPKLIILLLLLSNTAFAKELPDSLDEERSMDEALEVVDRSKEDRKQFDNRGPERGMASEKDFDPEYQKDFDEMMKDVDQY